MNRRDRRASGKTGAIDGDALARLFSEAVASHQAGRLMDAVSRYRQVLAAAPSLAEAHHNLGLALKGLGKTVEAGACLRRALALKPDYPEAHNSLGNLLADGGDAAAAAESFRRAVALAPGFAVAHHNLGAVMKDLGRLDEAEAAIRAALARDSAYAEAHNTLGTVLAATGRPAEALDHYRLALALDPALTRVRANLAEALRRLGRSEAAEVEARLAVEAEPTLGLAHTVLGAALKDLGRLDAAQAAFAIAARLLPDRPEAHDNLGGALAELGRLAEAEAACRQALRLAADFATAHNNLGNALRDQGRRAEAEECFRRALELAPEMAEARTSLGMARLYRGDFAAGWRDFEARWQTGRLANRDVPQPQWRGDTPLAGKTVLFHAEQGFGDTIQFLRYAPLLAERGARVIAEVQPALARLAERVDGVARVIPQGAAWPEFDLHLPMMSAPVAFGTTLDSVPSTIPYLSADPAAWAAPPSAGRRVGLVWAGDPRPHDPGAHAADRRRSIPLTAFAPLLALASHTFVSLQKGAGAAQLAPEMGIIDPMAEVADFADTAAVVLHLDLVITVDTAIAHLAGALGKPVWILSRYDGCWRWLERGDTSPWYPTARLFRQTRPGDWESVVAAVAAALAER